MLGAGMIAEVHRRAALLAGAEVVGVMASSPERSRAAARAWDVAAYDDLAQVAAADVDVVHVCTPNDSHVPYAVALLRAGKHVVCEKPLGLDAAGAARAAAVATETGLVATVPFVFRYHPMTRVMRARAQAEDFGRTHLVHGSYLQDWMLSPTATSWRVDPALGGRSRAFGDIGSHWCDLAEWVTGDRIASLVATTSVVVPQRPAPATGGRTTGERMEVETEDDALVLFRTVGGAAGSVVISQAAPGRTARLWLEVDGARGSVTLDQDHPDELWVGSGTDHQTVPRDPGHDPEGGATGLEQWFEGFVADTYAAVRGERPDGLPTFADGLRAAQVCDAVLTSAATGRWVDVPPPGTPVPDRSEGATP